MDRSDIHDRSPILPLHLWNGIFAAQPKSPKIHRREAIEFVLTRFRHRSYQRDSGVIHQNVEASVLLDDSLHRPAYVIGPAYIAGNYRPCSPDPANPVADRFCAAAVDVENNHMGTLSSE